MLNNKEFEQLCLYALEEFRDMEPQDSKNMKDTATEGKPNGPFKFRIRIDPDKAPYSVYTVIPWSETSPIIINAPKRPELKGRSSFLWNNGADEGMRTPKKNPNEGWIDIAVEALAQYIAYLIDGEVHISG